MEVAMLYIVGVVLGWIIAKMVETSCESLSAFKRSAFKGETCTQQICDDHPEQVSRGHPADAKPSNQLLRDLLSASGPTCLPGFPGIRIPRPQAFLRLKNYCIYDLRSLF